jgi:lysophospholipase L1-like esterase
MWRNRPGVRRRYVDVFAPAAAETERAALLGRFLPWLPTALREHPTWEVTLDDRGFRGPGFSPSKRPSALRVVCLGDSWTFGANVAQADAYPQQLQGLLHERFPAADVEVLNLGVMGYTSYQGLVLLRREALALQPDVVVIAFGMNDSSVAGFRDKDVAAAPPASAARRALAVAGRLEVVKLLRYAAQRLTYRPAPPSAEIGAAAQGTHGAGHRAETADEYAALEPWTRVALDDYRANVRDMVRQARDRGAGVVLVFNELWETSPYAAALAEVAGAEGVAFVNGAALVARARERQAVELERQLGLHPSTAAFPGDTADAVEIVFRVRAGTEPVPRALYVVGADPALGGLVPNRVALHDDGLGGDERAGDGVWSVLVRPQPGARVAYEYTNSGREGQWEGLDVPAVRELRLDGTRAGERRYGPIDTFGRLALQADAWHTDAGGYRLIAAAVLDALLRDAGVSRRLAAVTPSGGPRR